MDKKKLAIFDLDGTLFDTVDVNYHAYRAALFPYGIDLERAYFLTHCNGRHYTEFLPAVMGTTRNIEDVHRAKKMMYAANMDRVRENKQIFEIIKCLKDRYYIVIVTTASRQNTEDILSYFNHEHLFEYLITQEDVTEVKPSPQGFLMAMEYFKIAPADTIIFEDSDVGIQAARATGAAVMVVDRF